MNGQPIEIEGVPCTIYTPEMGYIVFRCDGRQLNFGESCTSREAAIAEARREIQSMDPLAAIDALRDLCIQSMQDGTYRQDPDEETE